VAFGEGTCSSLSVSTRFRRTFCMRFCDDDSDCRGGSYKCIDLSQDQSRQVVDENPPSRRICGVPSSDGTAPAPATPPDPPACFPSDASFQGSRPETGPISRAAPASEASTSDVADSSPGETGADGASDDTSDGASVDANDEVTADAAEEPEAS